MSDDLEITDTLAGAMLERDYDVLLSVLAETARGCWFLQEYIRRNRHPDSGQTVRAIRASGEADEIPTGAATRLKTPAADKEMLADLVAAIEEADIILATTEQAVVEILEAGERIQTVAGEIAAALPEQQPACDELTARATEIFTSCAFQDLTGQRVSRVLNLLREIETYISGQDEGGTKAEKTHHSPSGDKFKPNAANKESQLATEMVNGPQPADHARTQNEVDQVIGGIFSEVDCSDGDDLDPPHLAMIAAAVDEADDFAPAPAYTPRLDDTVMITLEEDAPTVAAESRTACAPPPEREAVVAAIADFLAEQDGAKKREITDKILDRG